jgi:hypothetical protein
MIDEGDCGAVGGMNIVPRAIVCTPLPMRGQ